MLSVDRETLEREYGEELRGGAVKTNIKVAENLFRKATGDGPQAIAAAILWLETRAGWKETAVHEHGGAEGMPLVIVRQIVDPRDEQAATSALLIEARPVDSDDD